MYEFTGTNYTTRTNVRTKERKTCMSPTRRNWIHKPNFRLHLPTSLITCTTQDPSTNVGVLWMFSRLLNSLEDTIISPLPSFFFFFTFIYPLTARVVGEPQMTSQPVSSIFLFFSTALWDLANSKPIQCLMLSSNLFPCLHCLLLPFTVPRKGV